MSAGNATDVLLFFAILGLCGAWFSVLHLLALRYHDTSRLLVFLMLTYLFSAALATAVSRFFLAGYFSSSACYLVANVGAVVAGFFAAFLYAFLGPATADRSLTAHLLIHLLGKPHLRAQKSELENEYVAENFFSKRYSECINARILEEDGEIVALTAKGARIARLYLLQLKLLGLDRRTQHLPSFVNKK